MKLTSDYKTACLKTVVGATREDARKRKTTIPYATLRAKLYEE